MSLKLWLLCLPAVLLLPQGAPLAAPVEIEGLGPQRNVNFHFSYVHSAGLPSGSLTLWGALDFRDADGDGLLGALRFERTYANGSREIGAWYFYDEPFGAAVSRPLGPRHGTLPRHWRKWPKVPGVYATGGLGIDIGAHGRPVQPIPEPHSVALFLLGSAIVGGSVWRSRSSSD